METQEQLRERAAEVVFGGTLLDLYEVLRREFPEFSFVEPLDKLTKYTRKENIYDFLTKSEQERAPSLLKVAAQREYAQHQGVWKSLVISALNAQDVVELINAAIEKQVRDVEDGIARQVLSGEESEDIDETTKRIDGQMLKRLRISAAGIEVYDLRS
ncbi:MAG: hypothetical protein A2542_02550 [Parcubacteria group bacterium RIFOXYD2_FULL_52_8]|nr:MAG: hypothetical protein A2542_02550 [Parcubacteria group bacterium RIFOXYD2_FULL_52_8]